MGGKQETCGGDQAARAVHARIIIRLPAAMESEISRVVCPV
jgi:hypothetical protein